MKDRKPIGVRQLKNETSRIINEVRERQAQYVVTRHGVPVAEIRPVAEAEARELADARAEEALQALERTARQVGDRATPGPSASELVSDLRR